MIQIPSIDQRVRQSLSANFASFSDPKASLESLAAELSIESLDLARDDYLKNVIYETLRIDTPVQMSTSFCVTEDIDIGGVNIRANEMMMANIYKLHHLEDQWGKDHD